VKNTRPFRTFVPEEQKSNTNYFDSSLAVRYFAVGSFYNNGMRYFHVYFISVREKKCNDSTKWQYKVSEFNSGAVKLNNYIYKKLNREIFNGVTIDASFKEQDQRRRSKLWFSYCVTLSILITRNSKVCLLF